MKIKIMYSPVGVTDRWNHAEKNDTKICALFCRSFIGRLGNIQN